MLEGIIIGLGKELQEKAEIKDDGATLSLSWQRVSTSNVASRARRRQIWRTRDGTTRDKGRLSV